MKGSRLVVCLLFWLVTASASNAAPVSVAGNHAHFILDNGEYLGVLDSSVERARVSLAKLLRDSLNYTPEIYLVGEIGQFNRLVGGSFPDWGAAAAIPYKRLIALKSPDRFPINRSLRELMAHEYSHLALAHRTGMYPPPRWFDEGLAMYVSMEWGWSNNLAMSKAAVFRQFISLGEIEKVNRFNQSRAEIAYAQSYLAVKYLIDRYKADVVNRFLDEIARGHSVDSALTVSIGGTQAEFDAEFQAYLAQRYNVNSLFMDTFWFWVFLAFVLVLGGIIKYRQRRKYYKRWEQEEKFESRDFDYGDPAHPEKPDEDDDEAWRG
jgi:hypothetical protein